MHASFLVLLLLLLLLSVHSINAANEPVPYTPTTPNGLCNSNDNTSNWNSFGYDAIRANPWTTFAPGKCMQGAVLFWPYHRHAAPNNPNNDNTLVYDPAKIVPNLQCRRYFDFYPGNSTGQHYHPDTYNFTNPTSPASIYMDYYDLFGHYVNPGLRYYWGMHVPPGYLCNLTCVDTTQQPVPKTLVYSDSGYQRMCHPSIVNQLTGSCRSASATTDAPYCINQAGRCTFDAYPYWEISCTQSTNLNRFQLNSTTSIGPMQQGETCYATLKRQTWNTYWSIFKQSSTLWSSSVNSITVTVYCPIGGTDPVSLTPLSDYAPYYALGNGPAGMTSCPSGYYGPTCLPCQPCADFYHKCDDGATGTGACVGPSDPCVSRTTSYGLKFMLDYSSSTGLCMATSTIAQTFVFMNVPAMTFGPLIGLATFHDHNQLYAQLTSTYTLNVVSTLTVSGMLINNANAFCNGNGQLYGSFKFDVWYVSGTLFFYMHGGQDAFLSSYATNLCECYNGYYGSQCQYTCNVPYNTTYNMICDPITGNPTCAVSTTLQVNGTCAPTECPFNTWGANCEHRCPICTYPASKCDRNTGQCICPDPTLQLDRTGTICTSYHCGLDPTHLCGGVTRGTCVNSTDGSGRTCYCKPGFHGKFCELNNEPYTPAIGMSFKDRDCDCGVLWSNMGTLDQYNQSITIIPIVSWATLYRNNYQRPDTNFVNTTAYDTNIWKMPIRWNRVMTISQAQQWCYQYRPCDGYLATQYGTTSGIPFFFITPFSIQTNRVFNNTFILNNLWYQTTNNPVVSASQVQVYSIQRTLGYDCQTTELDVLYYLKQNWHEIMYDYGLRFCDLSHRENTSDPTSRCCIKPFYCSYPAQQTFPVLDIVNDPWVNWVKRHYDEIGHRKRYAPNPYCDLWPTLYEETSMCRTEKDGCKRGIGNLPCSGQGRCRPTSINSTHPYQCLCRKFDTTVTSAVYYADETSKLNNQNTQGRRQFYGYDCATDLTNCVNPHVDVSRQSYCNGEIARCIGLQYPANSTFANPGLIIPHCDCSLINPAQQLYQESSNTGDWCELPRCGVDNSGCNKNSSTATCITNSQNQHVCQCSTDGIYGDSWIGPSCQVPADACIPPDPDSSGLFKLCGGPGFGVCMEAGAGFPSHTNYNTSHPWCDCTNANYTGLHCSYPLCKGTVVQPYHGYCEGALQDHAVCYPKWDGPDVGCTINKCELNGGGYPTDSKLPGSQPQDICKCSLGRAARDSGPRPGYSNDPPNTPTQAIGFCYAKCPTTSEFNVPPDYCGGHGHCEDPLINPSSNTSVATCVCDVGYIRKNFTHPQWNTTQQTCVPYCSNGGTVAMTSADWSLYLANPYTSNQPTCTCLNNGFWNDPDTGHKTCIDYRCQSDGIWTPTPLSSTGGTCECGLAHALYYPSTGCKISTCSGLLPDGTAANRGTVASDGKTCSCFAPYTWSNPNVRQDCNSDICHPHGYMYNTTINSQVGSKRPMTIGDTSRKGTSLCACTAPFSTKGCTTTTEYCNEYCNDSRCPNGGIPINNNVHNCTCPPPYVPPLCQDPCPLHVSVSDPIQGRCTCLYDWSDTTLGQCTQDPCNLGCPTPVTQPCGRFNLTTKSCDCFGSWQQVNFGTSCAFLNVTTATADCNHPNGYPTGPDSCACGFLWTGPHCNISTCASGSNVTYSIELQTQICSCPDGFTGPLCDVVAPPPTTLPPPVTPASSSSAFSTIDIIAVTASGMVVLGVAGIYILNYYGYVTRLGQLLAPK